MPFYQISSNGPEMAGEVEVSPGDWMPEFIYLPKFTCFWTIPSERNLSNAAFIL
jgi:hypothetical protein